MTDAAKKAGEIQPAEKEALTPDQKKNLEDTKRRHRGALERLSRL